LQRLEVLCSSDSSKGPWGPPVPGLWGFEQLLSDGACGGPPLLQQPAAAAASGAAAQGALREALGNLSVAIRNAACSKSEHYSVYTPRTHFMHLLQQQQQQQQQQQ